MLEPGNGKKATLIRPVLGPGHEPLADGIGADVFPFGREVFAATQLGVPALALPEGTRMRKREGKGDLGLPVFHPAVEVGNGNPPGYAQEVDMVRHDDVAGHKPVPGLAPGVEQAGYGGRMVEHALSTVCIDGDEKDNRMLLAPVNGVA